MALAEAQELGCLPDRNHATGEPHEHLNASLLCSYQGDAVVPVDRIPGLLTRSDSLIYVRVAVRS